MVLLKKLWVFWLLKGYKGKKKHKGVKKGVEMARLFFNQSYLTSFISETTKAR
jgi:hypothetical protein